VQLSHSGLQSKLLRVKKNSSFLRKLEPMESTTMVSNNVFLILMKKISHHIALSEILSLYWHKVKEDVPGVKDTTSLWLTGRVAKVKGVARGRGARSRFVNLPLGIKQQSKDGALYCRVYRTRGRRQIYRPFVPKDQRQSYVCRRGERRNP
jgi:hypothetical protein